MSDVQVDLPTLSGIVSLVVLIVGGSVKWYTDFRNDRRADKGVAREGQASDANVVIALTQQLATLQRRVDEVWEEGQKARKEASDASQEAQAARAEVAWMQRLLIRTVAPIISWLDGGANPPPPDVSPELRAILATAVAHDSGERT